MPSTGRCPRPAARPPPSERRLGRARWPPSGVHVAAPAQPERGGEEDHQVGEDYQDRVLPVDLRLRRSQEDDRPPPRLQRLHPLVQVAAHQERPQAPPPSRTAPAPPPGPPPPPHPPHR